MDDPPQSLSEVADWLRKHFRSEASSGLRATYEYVVSGPRGGVVALRVDDGMVDVRLAAAEAPDARFRSSDEDCFAVLAGRENADLLCLGGRLEVEGDLELALKVRTLFRARD